MQETLKRTIGLCGLSANIINTIVVAGIFVIPGIVTAGLGSPSIFAYLFCGYLVVLAQLRENSATTKSLYLTEIKFQFKKTIQ